MNPTFAAGVIFMIDYFYGGHNLSRFNQIANVYESLGRGNQGPPFVERASSLLLSLLNEEHRFRPDVQREALSSDPGILSDPNIACSQLDEPHSHDSTVGPIEDISQWLLNWQETNVPTDSAWDEDVLEWLSSLPSE